MYETQSHSHIRTCIQWWPKETLSYKPSNQECGSYAVIVVVSVVLYACMLFNCLNNYWKILVVIIKHEYNFAVKCTHTHTHTSPHKRTGKRSYIRIHLYICVLQYEKYLRRSFNNNYMCNETYAEWIERQSAITYNIIHIHIHIAAPWYAVECYGANAIESNNFYRLIHI